MSFPNKSTTKRSNINVVNYSRNKITELYDEWITAEEKVDIQKCLEELKQHSLTHTKAISYDSFQTSLDDMTREVRCQYIRRLYIGHDLASLMEKNIILDTFGTVFNWDK